MNSVNAKRHHHNSFYTASGGTVKRTNRHVAALDFLLNITMEKESAIRNAGMKSISRAQSSDKLNSSGEDNFEKQQQFVEDYNAGAAADFSGRKLQGAVPSLLKLTAELRYSMMKMTEQSAVVRHWESEMLLHGMKKGREESMDESPPLLNSRMFFSRARAYPMVTMSVIKYDAGEEAKKMSKLKMEDQKGLEVFVLPQRDWRGCSYKALFRPLVEERVGDYLFEKGYIHDPTALDDPNMIHGSHRYVLSRAAVTGPVLCSVILYVNENDLKESLNEAFHEKHPQIPPSLTLSKIRNLKKSALLGCLAVGVELSTVALAVVCFERLCLKGLVTKSNRHLSMSVCLLLAYKFNENVSSLNKDTLRGLLDFMDREWEISRSDVFSAEFGAFIHLGLALHIPRQHTHSVYGELLKLVHRTSRSYLGEEMEGMYNNDILNLEQWERDVLERGSHGSNS